MRGTLWAAAVADCCEELLKAAGYGKQQQHEEGAGLVGVHGQCVSLLQGALLALHLCLALLQLRHSPLALLRFQHCLGVHDFLQGSQVTPETI